MKGLLIRDNMKSGLNRQSWQVSPRVPATGILYKAPNLHQDQPSRLYHVPTLSWLIQFRQQVNFSNLISPDSASQPTLFPRGSHESSSDPDLISTTSRRSQPVPLTRLIIPHQSFSIKPLPTRLATSSFRAFAGKYSLGSIIIQGGVVRNPGLSLTQLYMARLGKHRELSWSTSG